MKLVVKHLGTSCDFKTCWQKMFDFTDNRQSETPDEIWLLQHKPVFTQGIAGKAEHIIDAKDIPVIKTDRGGQVTYHGPGQLIAYTLFDLNRHKLGPNRLVSKLQNSIIALLKAHNISGRCQRGAPGVYVDEAKICSLGLRVRKGYCYHGLALNVDMDLEPFNWINPCGYKDLNMIQLRELQPNIGFDKLTQQLIHAIATEFNYTITERIPHEAI